MQVEIILMNWKSICEDADNDWCIFRERNVNIFVVYFFIN
jgi:hypothetical protein